MNYLQTHNRHAFSRNRGLWVGISTIIIIVVFIQLIVPHFLPAIFTTIARPFWRMEFSATNGSLRSPEYLLSQNEDLKRQLADMTIRSQTTQSISNENSELKSLLNRPVSATATATSTASSTKVVALLTPSKYILAAVLRRPPVAAYDELIIDLGQNDGALTGNLVYAPGNVLVGTVSDTLGQTSKVVLFSSPGMTYEVLINNAATNKAVPATAHGLGGGQFSVQVPRDVISNIGDTVTVSSINNKTIGVVGGVITDPAKPFETILFTSLANIYDLRWVLVDTNRVTTSTVSTTKNVKK